MKGKFNPCARWIYLPHNQSHETLSFQSNHKISDSLYQVKSTPISQTLKTPLLWHLYQEVQLCCCCHRYCQLSYHNIESFKVSWSRSSALVLLHRLNNKSNPSDDHYAAERHNHGAYSAQPSYSSGWQFQGFVQHRRGKEMQIGKFVLRDPRQRS